MNDTINKPLHSIGEHLKTTSAEIPLLETQATSVLSSTGAPLLVPTKITNYHKIVFVLVKYRKALHRDDIAQKCEANVAAISVALQKLKGSNIVASPDWGYYAITARFLRNFQIEFGEWKTETLLKMFDDANIDYSEFDTSGTDDTASVASKETMLQTITAYVSTRKNRLTEIDNQIQQLNLEKTAIEEELLKLGQIVTV